MLILSRSLREGIQIGDDIELRVLAIEGGRVSIGLTAPKGVKILRSELYAREKRTRRAALDPDGALDIEVG